MSGTLAEIVDALEALVRTSQSGLPGGLAELPAGEAGFRAIVAQPGQTLGDHEIPHVFASTALERASTLAFQQRDGRLAVQLNIWTRGDVAGEAATRVEAIATALLADRTLGGLVDSLEIPSLAAMLAKLVGKPERNAALAVEFRRIT